jgi:hypothetical protein
VLVVVGKSHQYFGYNAPAYSAQMGPAAVGIFNPVAFGPLCFLEDVKSQGCVVGKLWEALEHLLAFLSCPQNVIEDRLFAQHPRYALSAGNPSASSRLRFRSASEFIGTPG